MPRARRVSVVSRVGLHPSADGSVIVSEGFIYLSGEEEGKQAVSFERVKAIYFWSYLLIFSSRKATY